MPLPLPEESAALVRASIEAVEDTDISRRCIEICKPHIAHQALFLLAAGTSLEDITEQTGVSKNALRRMRERHKDVLDSLKKESAHMAAIAANKGLQLIMRKLKQIEDDPDAAAKTSLKDLSITTAILTDKAAILSGDPTAVVEHRSGPSLDEYKDAIRKAKARIIDIPSEP